MKKYIPSAVIFALIILLLCTVPRAWADTTIAWRKQGDTPKISLLDPRKNFSDPLAYSLPKPPPKDTSPWKEPVTGIEFIWIPGGCFMMGQTESEKEWLQKVYREYHSDEPPCRKVCVDGFWMSKNEITNAQFAKFNPIHDSGRYKKYWLNRADQPVVNITWIGAKAFATWFSEKTDGYTRLPTDAEWEYAARAGSNDSNYWGNLAVDACFYANVRDRKTAAALNLPSNKIFPCNDGYPAVAPVGQLMPNKFGLYDMMGNVWEWCEDWVNEDLYSTLPSINPRMDVPSDAKVIRGGSWGNSEQAVRASVHSGVSPKEEHYDIGFRLVVIPD